MAWTDKQDGEKLFAVDINEVAHIAENSETVANTASNKADTALSTAQGIEAKADTAITTANSANTKADTALTNANTALDKADEAKQAVDDIDLSPYATKTYVQTEIANKQDKTTIEISQDEPVIVENNTEKRMIDGVITDTTLTIQLPNDTQKLWLEYDTEFVGSVIFDTGNSITGVGTVNIPLTVISGSDTQKVVYKGEDITVSNDEYVFTPAENKRYTFMYWWDGEYMICEVTAYELP